MKIAFNLIFVLVFSSSCIKKMHNTTWVVYNVTHEINNDSLQATNAFDYLINMKMYGVKFLIEKDSVKIRGGGFDTDGKLLSITAKELFIMDNDQEYQIKYFYLAIKENANLFLAMDQE